MTPKSPGQIMEEYDSFPMNWCDGCKTAISCATEDWLRSSLASVLLWAAEEMPKRESIDKHKYLEGEQRAYAYGESVGFNTGAALCRSILIEKAKELLRDTVNEVMQEIITEESVRRAAKESTEDQAEMIRKAKEITKE